MNIILVEKAHIFAQFQKQDTQSKFFETETESESRCFPFISSYSPQDRENFILLLGKKRNIFTLLSNFLLTIEKNKRNRCKSKEEKVASKRNFINQCFIENTHKVWDLNHDVLLCRFIIIRLWIDTFF